MPDSNGYLTPEEFANFVNESCGIQGALENGLSANRLNPHDTRTESLRVAWKNLEYTYADYRLYYDKVSLELDAWGA